MIGALRGQLLDSSGQKIYIETSGGAVYEILVPQRLASSLTIGMPLLIYTSLIVRENEMYLTGFEALGEKNLFEILITAKGIGPKQGLKILDALSPAELRLSIISGDTAALARIKGVGSKKAEQLILDLKEKMEKDISTADAALPAGSKKKTEVLLTMRALGYTDSEIKKPLDAFFESHGNEDSVEKLVALFLRNLKQ